MVSAAPDKMELDGVRCASDKDYQWWRDARFGIFIHWGPGAFVHAKSLSWPKIKGRPSFHELGYMADHTKADELSVADIEKYYGKYKFGGRKGIPSKLKIYNSLYKIFNPVKFDAEEIARMVKDAGASASSSVNPNSKRGSPETVVAYSFETGKLKKEYGEESDGKRIKTNNASCRSLDEKENARLKRMVGGNHRGHFWRYWQAKTKDKQPWLELDLGSDTTFSKVGVTDLFGHVRDFEIQAWIGGRWTTIYKSDTMDNLFVDLGVKITTSKVRVVILENSGEMPEIAMFDLFK